MQLTSFFIHLSISGNLGCSHAVATINNGTVNMGVHIFSRYLFCFLWINMRYGIARSYSSSIF